MKRIDIIFLIAIMLTSQTAVTMDYATPSGSYRSIPRDVFTICDSRKNGDHVEISTPDGILKATCTPMQGHLVAIPDRNYPQRELTAVSPAHQ